ncbi:hypothetical protein Tco_0357366 [Tanacetum coccineum]
MRIHGIAKVELASCEWGRSLRVMGLFDGEVVEMRGMMNSDMAGNGLVCLTGFWIIGVSPVFVKLLHRLKCLELIEVTTKPVLVSQAETPFYLLELGVELT